MTGASKGSGLLVLCQYHTAWLSEVRKAHSVRVAWKALLAVHILPFMLCSCCISESLRHRKQLLSMQVLVVMPPGAAGNAHPVKALQLGEAVACAPRDRYGCHMLLIASAIFVGPAYAWRVLMPVLVAVVSEGRL